MDDIVERLMAINHADAADAADEIERLRKEVDIKGSRLDDALDEIERLRTENAAMRRQALQNIIHISENAGLYQQP